MIHTLKSAAFILMLFLGTNLYAQKWNYGAKFELNYSGVSGNGISEALNLGYSGGVWATYALAPKFKLQPELIATQYNYRKADDFDKYYKNDAGRLNANDKIRLAYLNVPLLFRYDLLPILSVLAGPQAGIVFFEDENLRKDGINAFKRTEISAVAGVQVNLGTLGIYGRYNHGLSDISNMGSKYKWTSQHVQFGVSLRIK